MSENSEIEKEHNEEPEKEKAEKEKAAPATRNVVGVRFRSCGKIYDFQINGIDASPGSKVVVESEMGLSLATVAIARHEVQARGDLKKVIRLASEKDFQTIEDNRSLEKEARDFCVEKAKALGLEMKVVTTETTLDKKRLVFYFTADGRIDFRELVRDLAGKFKTRIEMRQIGVRDEVKMLGGIGACGRETCCNQFLTSFEPITIRMAKQQDLSINQSKLSGICGRLMCCLGYEVTESGSQRTSYPRKKEVREVLPDDKKKDEVLAQTSETAVTGKDQARPEQVRGEEKKKEEGSPEDKKGPRPHQKKKRFFKRDRKRLKKRHTEESPAEKTSAQPESAKQGEEAGKKESTRPSRKRRKFWKKKKQ
jgi:cell fate regulator YaaT (PSP1 superfamily)